MSVDAKVQIGLSTDFLEGVGVDTPAGMNLFREGVVISDPDVSGARAKITNTAPATDAYGLAVRVIGGVVVGSEVEIKNDTGNPIPVSGSVSVSNFPTTQAVSGTVTANAGTGTFAVSAASLPLPTGAATSASQTTGNTSLANLDSKLPDESGTWGYNAGTNGTLAVAANKRILAITATASPLTAASMTINAGQSITIPAGTTITISPRANLTAPTLVFTATTSYFVEFIE